MDRDQFESEVLALAAEGTKVTVANVAVRTRLPPRKVEAMLDDMVRHGHIHSDIDEADAVVVYTVKGLSPKVARKVTAQREREAYDDLQDRAMRSAGQVLVKQAATRAKGVIMAKPAAGEKSILYGGLFGLLGPIGLAYAAPWLHVLVTTAIYVVAFSLPVVRSIAGFFLLPIHIVTVFLGMAYAWRFNKEGKRAPILPPEEEPKQLR